MKNFAMLGKWHVHAPEYAEQLSKLPGCRVSKVWDPNEETAKEWAKALGCEVDTMEGILADPSIEGVVIGTATCDHPQIMIKACEAGKAVFTEKVLTLTSKDAEAVRNAVIANHTRFAISFPHYSESSVQFAVEAAKSGKLGDIYYARVRKAHNGSLANWLPAHFYDAAQCGGGAMIDLGAHPMYLLCELLGMPTEVQSAFTDVTGRGVEDNAVSLLRFENGAIGVSETGFISVGYPFTIDLSGTKGSLLLRDDQVSWCCEETGGKWQQVQNLPEVLPSPLAQWADTSKDISKLFDIDAAVRLSRVMEMAYAK